MEILTSKEIEDYIDISTENKKWVSVDDLKKYIKKRRNCPNNIPAAWELNLLEKELGE